MYRDRPRAYLRFVVGAPGQDPRTLWGLLRDPKTDRLPSCLQSHEIELWDDVLDWFNEHMNVPPFRWKPLPRQAVCWLRDDAHEAIRHMRCLAYLLREAGFPTRVLVERRPGRVVWEDELQVVAVPWRGRR